MSNEDEGKGKVSRRNFLLGAAGAGLDALFITGGLSAEETGTAPRGQPDAARLEAHLREERQAPAYAMV